MVRKISIAEVKKHCHKKSVWTIIHDDVYDVTSFLEEHPGGEDTLLEVAGKDGTQGFEDVGHSADARVLLKKYKIGTVPPEERSKMSNANCLHIPKQNNENTWQTYDRSPDRRERSRSRSPKLQRKISTCFTPERRIQSIVVPRERTRRRSPLPPRSSKLKWAILALAGAIVIGVVLHKYLK